MRISHGEAGGKAWRAAGDVPSEAKERLRGGREGRSRGELGNEEREDVAGLASGWGPDVRACACTAVGGLIARRSISWIIVEPPYLKEVILEFLVNIFL